ncbi:hypothetical protein [Paenibacillus sp. KS-LC4]|uniref:nucleoside-diphosphate sugar epimerase/dehydratase n=1 Tax=Paenibacillus sp. KS-LC4 TaxID=2979727 RepID=UPI0030D311E2
MRGKHGELSSNELIASITYGKKVVIWGTGAAYSEISSFVLDNCEVSYFIDNNPLKWAEQVNDCPIYSSNILKEEIKEELIVFIASTATDEIVRQLEQLNITKKQYVTFNELRRIKRELRMEELNSEIIFNKKEYYDNLMQAFSEIRYREIIFSYVLNSEFCSLIDYLCSPEVERYLYYPPNRLEYKLCGQGKMLFSNLLPGRQDYFQLMKASASLINQANISFLVKREEDISAYYEEQQLLTFENRASHAYLSSNDETMQSLVKQMKLPVNEEEISWLCSWMNFYKNYIDFMYDFLQKQDFKMNISVNEVFGYQNVITQIMNELQRDTITMQHSITAQAEQLTEHLNKHPMTDFTHYYLLAKHHIVWGQKYKEIMEGYGVPSEQIIILGNPKYNYDAKIKRTFYRTREINSFCVFLSYPAYNNFNVNMQLINIAEKIANDFNLNYYIRKHPTDFKSYPINSLSHCLGEIAHDKTIIELLDLIDFSFVSASTTFLESIYHYVPAFAYESEDTPLFSDYFALDSKFVFSNELEANEVVSQLIASQMETVNDLNQVSNSYIITDHNLPAVKYKNFYSRYTT